MKIKICKNCKKLMPVAARHCGSCGAAMPAFVNLTEEQELRAVRKLSGAEPVEKTGKYRLMSLGMKALPAMYCFVGFLMLRAAASSHNEHLEHRRRMEAWEKAHFSNSSLTTTTDSGDSFFSTWCLLLVIGVIVASLVSFFVLRNRREELVREYQGRERSELYRFRQTFAIDQPAPTSALAPAPARAAAPAETSGVQTLRFYSICEANRALAQMSDVSDVKVNYDTSTAYGLIANHTDLRSLTVTVVRTGRDTGAVCQITDHEYTRLYIEDRSNMVDKLQALNPHVRIMSVQSVTNSRGQTGIGMMLGIGVASHRHVFVLYRVRRDQPAVINF
ncbi:MAG: hypothetical protein IJ746_02065 [Ruminococcus sp.]|nr:hypothetical protein [Ruminococcus sp.]